MQNVLIFFQNLLQSNDVKQSKQLQYNNFDSSGAWYFH
jgi:hypothetical protein